MTCLPFSHTAAPKKVSSNFHECSHTFKKTSFYRGKPAQKSYNSSVTAACPNYRAECMKTYKDKRFFHHLHGEVYKSDKVNRKGWWKVGYGEVNVRSPQGWRQGKQPLNLPIHLPACLIDWDDNVLIINSFSCGWSGRF